MWPTIRENSSEANVVYNDQNKDADWSILSVTMDDFDIVLHVIMPLLLRALQFSGGSRGRLRSWGGVRGVLTPPFCLLSFLFKTESKRAPIIFCHLKCNLMRHLVPGSAHSDDTIIAISHYALYCNVNWRLRFTFVSSVWRFKGTIYFSCDEPKTPWRIMVPCVAEHRSRGFQVRHLKPEPFQYLLFCKIIKVFTIKM